MPDRFVNISKLELAAPSRREGLREAYQKAGKVVQINGKPFVQISEANYQRIRREFPPLETIIAQKAATSMITGKPPQKTVTARQLPSMGRMAMNAARAASRVVTSVAAGQPAYVGDAVFQKRIAICDGCEFFDKATERCGNCGCFMASQIIGKARLAAMSCPIGKWAAELKTDN